MICEHTKTETYEIAVLQECTSQECVKIVLQSITNLYSLKDDKAHMLLFKFEEVRSFFVGAYL